MNWRIDSSYPCYYHLVLNEKDSLIAACRDFEGARLIARAPKMLEALREIAKGAIVSPDQSPEQIAKQSLRALQIAREAAAEYMIYAGRQQQRAERAEAALEAIAASGPPRRGNADDIMEVYYQCREIARVAIAAVKGEQ